MEIKGQCVVCSFFSSRIARVLRFGHAVCSFTRLGTVINLASIILTL